MLTKDELINKLREISNNNINGIYQSGIHNKKNDGYSVLRSVRGTYYYKDDLSDCNNIKYTLSGKNGNQFTTKGFNKVLLSKLIHYVYLYEEFKNDENIQYYRWFGKYKKGGYYYSTCIGENGMLRDIYILKLIKIES